MGRRFKMNKRIVELAVQARKHFPKTETSDEYWVFDEEKFTELILQECSKVILKWKKEPFPFDEDLAVQLIHEHFGFEVPHKHIKVIKI